MTPGTRQNSAAVGQIIVRGRLNAAEAGGDTAAIRQLPVVLMSEYRRLPFLTTQALAGHPPSRATYR